MSLQWAGKRYQEARGVTKYSRGVKRHVVVIRLGIYRNHRGRH
jgi:hypothetical protein